MKISILTLFPEMFSGPFDQSMIKRAKEKELVQIEYINIRDFGIGTHQVVDDTPYGGGIGMLMRIDVLAPAIQHVKESFIQQSNIRTIKQSVVLMSARGKTFNQKLAQEYTTLDHLILICGHYEGVDERIKNFIDEEISIGDFILTGGEIPSMLITDAIVRLLPGVLKQGATEHESFTYDVHGEKMLEFPQYTKPPLYNGHEVPPVLLSGNHKVIEEWRKKRSKKIYKKSKRRFTY
jgi:tRNA (guanine37-N1)-methyltransferase